MGQETSGVKATPHPKMQIGCSEALEKWDPHPRSSKDLAITAWSWAKLEAMGSPKSLSAFAKNRRRPNLLLIIFHQDSRRSLKWPVGGCWGARHGHGFRPGSESAADGSPLRFHSGCNRRPRAAECWGLGQLVWLGEKTRDGAPKQASTKNKQTNTIVINSTFMIYEHRFTFAKERLKHVETRRFLGPAGCQHFVGVGSHPLQRSTSPLFHGRAGRETWGTHGDPG